MPRTKARAFRAFTEKDNRFTIANKINNSTWKCPQDNAVRANQKGNVVTITCGCNKSHSKVVGGIIDEHDAFADFCDNH